jgi:hypothetical protein
MGSQRISRQSAKQKARQLQQYACERIARLTGYTWGKQGEDHPIESRPMGQAGADVRLETHVLKEFPFSVECKRMERWQVPQWAEQAKQNRLPGTYWLIIAKKNRQRPVAILDADTFFDLLEQVKEQE